MSPPTIEQMRPASAEHLTGGDAPLVDFDQNPGSDTPESSLDTMSVLGEAMHLPLDITIDKITESTADEVTTMKPDPEAQTDTFSVPAGQIGAEELDFAEKVAKRLMKGRVICGIGYDDIAATAITKIIKLGGIPKPRDPNTNILRAYITKVVQSTAMDAFRKFSHIPPFEPFDEKGHGGSYDHTPETQVMKRLLDPEVENALRKLTGNQHTAIQLVTRGLHPQDIARELGITDPAARSRIHSALVTLREELIAS